MGSFDWRLCLIPVVPMWLKHWFVRRTGMFRDGAPLFPMKVAHGHTKNVFRFFRLLCFHRASTLKLIFVCTGSLAHCLLIPCTHKWNKMFFVTNIYLLFFYYYFIVFIDSYQSFSSYKDFYIPKNVAMVDGSQHIRGGYQFWTSSNHQVWKIRLKLQFREWQLKAVSRS